LRGDLGSQAHRGPSSGHDSRLAGGDERSSVSGSIFFKVLESRGRPRQATAAPAPA